MILNPAVNLYQDVPAAQREEFLKFRASHPYKHIRVGDIQWEYIASGDGPETILILGGAMAMGDTAFKTITRLENRFKIISPSYPAASQASVVCEGLAAILNEEGAPKAHVTGHSLGAGVAHVFVRRCPERVGRLVLDGFGLYTPRHTLIAKLFFKLPYPFIIGYYRRMINRVLGGSDDPETMFWHAYMSELLTRLHDRTKFMAQFGLLFDLFDQADEYGVFKPVEKPGEVLLILAKDDHGFSAEERQALIASYPGAQVHWFESGGHLSGFTQKEEFNQVYDRFLRGELP